MIDHRDINEYVGKPENLHGLIGYCPQSNTFNGALTVKQSLMLFGKIVGFDDENL